ncbi:MAG: hypothetical protein K9L78_00495 [Victivallales bacterium]|nr:hypothetical protein [Victivallales bacterium]MCF7888574.1 hypothetical protein [Victivallales bacterium]
MNDSYYFIKDIIPDEISELKVLFVFESPYKQELVNGYPVAGSSGKTISKFLNKIDPAIPVNLSFGQYMTFFKDTRFGIVNCSNYPMDKAVYGPDTEMPFPIEHLDSIRKKLSGSGKIKKELTSTYQKLLKDFEGRIQKYTLKNTSLIVLCGKVALNFYNDTKLNLANETVSVPHPSRNQWAYRKYAETMSRLKDFIKYKILGTLNPGSTVAKKSNSA